MDNYKISKNYAKALFMLAGEMDSYSRVAEDMMLVNEVFSENRELHVVFTNPVIRHDRKISIIEALFAGHVSQLTSQFLHFVVRKNRAINLRGISSMYLDMDRERRGVVLAEMSTSYPIESDVRAMVGELVAHVSGKDVEVRERVDSSIIGGFVVKFDNNMFDTRIRTQIANLRKQFSENEYESKL